MSTPTLAADALLTALVQPRQSVFDDPASPPKFGARYGLTLVL